MCQRTKVRDVDGPCPIGRSALALTGPFGLVSFPLTERRVVAYAKLPSYMPAFRVCVPAGAPFIL